MVLTYFSSNAEVLSKSTPELLSVLNHIDSQDLLPPIQVVQALARSDVASISLIKRYIGKKIEHEREELSQACLFLNDPNLLWMLIRYIIERRADSKLP